MSGEATIRLDILVGVFDQVEDIIGADSSYSMLHYAALEQGRLLGASAVDERTLAETLARVGPLVGTHLEAILDSPQELQIRAPDFAACLKSRSAQAVLMGLLEGLVSRARNRPYSARWNGEALSGVIHLEPTRSASAGVPG
jgi:hypothetical protein